MSRNNDFQCGDCRVYHTQIVLADDDARSIEKIESIKLNFHFLPENSPSNFTSNFTSNNRSGCVDLTSGEEEEAPTRCLEKESPPEVVQCEKCDYIHTNKEDLEAHILRTHVFACDECELQFGVQKELEEHTEDVHDK